MTYEWSYIASGTIEASSREAAQEQVSWLLRGAIEAEDIDVTEINGDESD